MTIKPTPAQRAAKLALGALVAFESAEADLQEAARLYAADAEAAREHADRLADAAAVARHRAAGLEEEADRATRIAARLADLTS